MDSAAGFCWLGASGNNTRPGRAAGISSGEGYLKAAQELQFFQELP